jgi:hypothetical protein
MLVVIVDFFFVSSSSKVFSTDSELPFTRGAFCRGMSCGSAGHILPLSCTCRPETSRSSWKRENGQKTVSTECYIHVQVQEHDTTSHSIDFRSVERYYFFAVTDLMHSETLRTVDSCGYLFFLTEGVVYHKLILETSTTEKVRMIS